MPGFSHSLVGIGNLCDIACTITFTKHGVTVYEPPGDTIISGWQEQAGNKLCCFALRPNQQLAQPGNAHTDIAFAFGAFYLPSVETLVCFYQAAAELPIKSTYLAAIKEGNYSTWKGLSHDNAAK